MEFYYCPLVGSDGGAAGEDEGASVMVGMTLGSVVVGTTTLDFVVVRTMFGLVGGGMMLTSNPASVASVG